MVLCPPRGNIEIDGKPMPDNLFKIVKTPWEVGSGCTHVTGTTAGEREGGAEERAQGAG